MKYAMSGASEKANLKGVLPKYIFGLILIICCLTIVTAVVNIAGNEGASDIIEQGLRAGEHMTGETPSNSYHRTNNGSTGAGKPNSMMNGKPVDTLN